MMTCCCQSIIVLCLLDTFTPSWRDSLCTVHERWSQMHFLDEWIHVSHLTPASGPEGVSAVDRGWERVRERLCLTSWTLISEEFTDCRTSELLFSLKKNMNHRVIILYVNTKRSFMSEE